MDIDTILKVIGIVMGSIITFSAFVAAVVYLLEQHKKGTRALLQEDFKQINEKIDNFHTEVNGRFDKVDERQANSDMAACKNFLVRCLDDFEQGKKTSPVTIERFWNQYDYYISKGKNSSIKSRTQYLVSTGQLQRISKFECITKGDKQC